MSHIAVDLKVIEVLAPGVARGAGISEDRALAGLIRLWHRCWSTKSATVTRTGVAAVFGAESVETILEALVDARFLEPTDALTWRVKGADKYLRITDARSAAGKARAGEAGRFAGRFTSTPPAPDQQATSTPPANDQLLHRAPSTEHRTPNTEKDEQQPPQNIPIAAFEIKEPDIELVDTWGKEDFWRAAEVTRRAMGYPPQKWPTPLALSRWWSEARGIAEVRELAQAFTRFAGDRHWKTATPPAPFGGFMTQWSNFLPSKGP